MKYGWSIEVKWSRCSHWPEKLFCIALIPMKTRLGNVSRLLRAVFGKAWRFWPLTYLDRRESRNQPRMTTVQRGCGPPRGCGRRGTQRIILFDEKAQTLWLLYFISTQLPPVSRPTVLRVRRLMGPTGTIVAFRLHRDVTEGSVHVYIEILRGSVLMSGHIFWGDE